MSGFSLVDEPWIPVTAGGRRVEVSLRDALVRAHEFDGLAVDDPLETVALLRQVLLPVVIDAWGPPRSAVEWQERWSAGTFPAEVIDKYLTEHADRFDLFSAQHPFAQVAGLRTAKDETKPTSVLVPRLAAGNNVPLFSVRTDDRPPVLAPAQAARAVLAAHCWDTAAIKSGAADDPQVKAGKTTGNPTGPVGQLGVVIPMGRTLAETLLLNTPILRAGLAHGDRPQWRSEHGGPGSVPPFGPAWSVRPPLGLLDLLTWQSRRIRLVPESDAGGASTASPTGVSRVVLCAGDRLNRLPHDLEPHTTWQAVPKPAQGAPPQRPIRHQPGRAAWRGIDALLAEHSSGVKKSTSLLLAQLRTLRDRGRVPADLPLQVLTVGLAYGNQSAVVEDMMVDTVPLPIAALQAGSPVHDLVLSVTDQADQLRQAANHLVDDLRAATRADKLSWDKGEHLGDVLLHALTPAVRRLLTGLQREPERVEQADDAWRDIARRTAADIAEPIVAAASPVAFLGRDDGKYTYRLSAAYGKYRRAITKILGPSAPPADPTVESSGAA